MGKWLETTAFFTVCMSTVLVHLFFSFLNDILVGCSLCCVFMFNFPAKMKKTWGDTLFSFHHQMSI